MTYDLQALKEADEIRGKARADATALLSLAERDVEIHELLRRRSREGALGGEGGHTRGGSGTGDATVGGKRPGVREGYLPSRTLKQERERERGEAVSPGSREQTVRGLAGGRDKEEGVGHNPQADPPRGKQSDKGGEGGAADQLVKGM